MRIKPRAFGVALGIVWGINWFALAWWMILQEGATHEITLIGRIYRGFNLSPLGSLAALGWGFLDGFLIGLLVSWIYNFLAARSN